MDLAQAVKIVSSLAEGTDPTTGEIFPQDSPYQQPEVVRALYTVVHSLQRKADKVERRRNLPENAGKAWTAPEEEELAAAFDAGRSVGELASAHGRTAGSIVARLVKLGKLDPEKFAFRPGRPSAPGSAGQPKEI